MKKATASDPLHPPADQTLSVSLSHFIATLKANTLLAPLLNPPIVLRYIISFHHESYPSRGCYSKIEGQHAEVSCAEENHVSDCSQPVSNNGGIRARI